MIQIALGKALSAKELGKVLPTKIYANLIGLIPGVFFGVCILLGNPELICRLALQSRETLGFGRYADLAVASFLAFVVGSGFILVATLIQFTLGLLYRFQRLV
jgi:membrane protease YdiL (CAAX protease family)